MDLGIRGKQALICGSSKGLGLGCATGLADAGVNLIMNARSESTLLKSAEMITRTYGVDVTVAVGDITDHERFRFKAATPNWNLHDHKAQPEYVAITFDQQVVPQSVFTLKGF